MIETWTMAFPALLCLYVMVCATLHVLFSEARVKQPTRTNLGVSILVPAHNEEAVIVECLEALLQSDYPFVEIHVLSDGSTDRTVELVRGFAARGVRLHDFKTNVGKSVALQTALDALTTELVMVVDADTYLAPNAISEMVAVFDDERVVGATANIQVKNATTLLAQLQAVEYASIIGLMKRANSLWGGLFTVSGAASMFRTSAVRAVGGFASPSITEDIELSWRLQHRGGTLVYAPKAIASIEVPPNWRTLWRQRTRWSQGLTEVLRLHRAGIGSRKPALGVFVVESLLCMSWLIALAFGLVVDVVHHAMGEAVTSDLGFWHVLSITLFLCQTVTAATLDSHYAKLPWSRLLVSVLYPFYFLALVMPTSLIGWCKGLISTNAARWERSERSTLAEART